MLTMRVDYERLNGRYTNAEYHGKITRCDLTLNIKYRPVLRGVRVGGGVRSHPPSCANYFKIMQIFTRNWVYTPDFGLKSSTPFVKPLNSHPPPPPPAPFSKVCVRAWNNQLF